MNNIVLIGMAGAGKTTIAKALSKAIDMPYLDCDEYIEEKSHCTIQELFNYGEREFRMLEAQAIKELSEKEDMIIATGGGVIENEGNILQLKKNGTLFWINRQGELILQEESLWQRPLLKRGREAFESLYLRRLPLYEKYGDVEIKNDGSVEEAIEKIVMYLKSHSN